MFCKLDLALDILVTTEKAHLDTGKHKLTYRMCLLTVTC